MMTPPFTHREQRDFHSGIPRVVHFCFGMAADFGGRPFSLCHYLAIRSAWEVIQPECMILHCAHEPAGEWWELARPYVHVHSVRPVSGIYGFPAAHPAHRADIVRLAALIAMGGIYLDTDVLVVRPFDCLQDAEFVAAREVTADGSLVGLSNAVLLAKTGSRFARLCLDGHNPRQSLWQGFRSQGRDEHYVEYSVRYPCMLADLCPGLLKVLPPESFLWATWDAPGLKVLFEEDRVVPAGVLALHLWESHSWEKYLSKLTPEAIRAVETTFNRLARSFLPDSNEVQRVGKSAAPDPAALARMDAICEDVDFILPLHLPPASLRQKAGRWMRRSLNSLRNEVTLPLRCRLDLIERRIETHLSTLGPPPPDSTETTPLVGRPLLRFGLLDGSRALLESRLMRNQNGAITFAMLTGASAEPGVCAWLASQPNAAGVWASASLPRAKQLGEWSLETGTLVRCIHWDAATQDCNAPIPAPLVPAPLSVLILAGTGSELGQWSALGGCTPAIVLIACNPLLLAQRATSDDPSALRWGASRTACMDLATTKGFALVAESPDGLFLIFEHSDAAAILVRASKPEPSSACIRVRTLYGQAIHLPLDEANERIRPEDSMTSGSAP